MSIPSVIMGFWAVTPSGPVTGKLRVTFDPKVFVFPFQMAAEMTALSDETASVAEPMNAIWLVPGPRLQPDPAEGVAEVLGVACRCCPLPRGVKYRFALQAVPL